MAYTMTEEEKKKLNGGNPSAADAAALPTPSSGVDGGAVQNAQSAQQRAYDPQTNQNYVTAMNALKQVEQTAPKYAGSYDQSVMEAFNKIANRGKFSYDVSTDPLYEQLRQEYAQQGQLAMRDTMGQAAGLTGGYGSSYAQSVGQQQYDAYLQRLNEVVPELEANAYAEYQAEGNELKDQYSMLSDLRDKEYAQYEDAYDRWFNERSYAQNAAENEYARGRQEWADQQAIEEQQYERMGDSRNYVTALIGYGYNPSDEELAGAGMTRPQANQLLYSYYKDNKLTVPAWLNEALGIETQSAGGGGKAKLSAYDQLVADLKYSVLNEGEIDEDGTVSNDAWRRKQINAELAAGSITQAEASGLLREYTAGGAGTVSAKKSAASNGTVKNRTASSR